MLTIAVHLNEHVIILIGRILILIFPALLDANVVLPVVLRLEEVELLLDAVYGLPDGQLEGGPLRLKY